MVKAWLLADGQDALLDIDALRETTGVLYWKIDVDSGNYDKLDEICQERGYNYRDFLEVSKESLGDKFEEKSKLFRTEHFHQDEEIRLVMEGIGTWDIRDNQDRWVRVQLTRGDLGIFPAKKHHRGAAHENRVYLMRLFRDSPTWEATFRHNNEKFTV